MRLTPTVLLILVVNLSGATSGLAAQEEVEALVALPTAPPGVVFEIVSAQDDALAWAIPEVRRQAERLRTRFPGLPIAVVSHGNEQFALTKANSARHRAVHEGVRQLTRAQDVEVHVCATYASWRQLEPEDFSDYVNVAAVGPVAIKNYREIGYRHVLVRRPKGE